MTYLCKIFATLIIDKGRALIIESIFFSVLKDDVFDGDFDVNVLSR